MGYRCQSGGLVEHPTLKVPLVCSCCLGVCRSRGTDYRLTPPCALLLAGAVGRDGVLGRVPQSVVDDEDSSLQTALQASLELQGLQRVANNAQQQYLRSRPAPSPESIKRAKELDLAELGLHPLFSEIGQGGVGEGGRVPHNPDWPYTLPSPAGSCFEEGELQRLRLVDSIKNYRTRTVSGPRATPRGFPCEVLAIPCWFCWPFLGPFPLFWSIPVTRGRSCVGRHFLPLEDRLNPLRDGVRSLPSRGLMSLPTQP